MGREIHLFIFIRGWSLGALFLLIFTFRFMAQPGLVDYFCRPFELAEKTESIWLVFATTSLFIGNFGLVQSAHGIFFFSFNFFSGVIALGCVKGKPCLMSRSELLTDWVDGLRLFFVQCYM